MVLMCPAGSCHCAVISQNPGKPVAVFVPPPRTGATWVPLVLTMALTIEKPDADRDPADPRPLRTN